VDPHLLLDDREVVLGAAADDGSGHRTAHRDRPEGGPLGVGGHADVAVGDHADDPAYLVHDREAPHVVLPEEAARRVQTVLGEAGPNLPDHQVPDLHLALRPPVRRRCKEWSSVEDAVSASLSGDARGSVAPRGAERPAGSAKRTLEVGLEGVACCGAGGFHRRPSRGVRGRARRPSPDPSRAGTVPHRAEGDPRGDAADRSCHALTTGTSWQEARHLAPPLQGAPIVCPRSSRERSP